MGGRDNTDPLITGTEHLSSFLSVYTFGFTLIRELLSEGLEQCILDLVVIPWGKKLSLLS